MKTSLPERCLKGLQQVVSLLPSIDPLSAAADRAELLLRSATCSDPQLRAYIEEHAGQWRLNREETIRQTLELAIVDAHVPAGASVVVELPDVGAATEYDLLRMILPFLTRRVHLLSEYGVCLLSDSATLGHVGNALLRCVAGIHEPCPAPPEPGMVPALGSTIVARGQSTTLRFGFGGITAMKRGHIDGRASLLLKTGETKGEPSSEYLLKPSWFLLQENMKDQIDLKRVHGFFAGERRLLFVAKGSKKAGVHEGIDEGIKEYFKGYEEMFPL